MKPMELSQNHDLDEKPDRQSSKSQARAEPVGAGPAEDADECSDVQHPESEKDESRDQEVAESSMHHRDGHLHQAAVRLCHQKGAADERAQPLVPEDDEKDDPLPCSLTGTRALDDHRGTSQRQSS